MGIGCERMCVIGFEEMVMVVVVVAAVAAAVVVVVVVQKYNNGVSFANRREIE